MRSPVCGPLHHRPRFASPHILQAVMMHFGCSLSKGEANAQEQDATSHSKDEAVPGSLHDQLPLKGKPGKIGNSLDFLRSPLSLNPFGDQIFLKLFIISLHISLVRLVGENYLLDSTRLSLLLVQNGEEGTSHRPTNKVSFYLSPTLAAGAYRKGAVYYRESARGPELPFPVLHMVLIYDSF